MASLVVVFPAEPVTPISGLPHSLRTAVARVCSATSVSSTASSRAFHRKAMQLILAHHRRHRALFERGVHVIVAVEALALDRKEQFAAADGARVDGISVRDFFAWKDCAGSGDEFGNFRERSASCPVAFLLQPRAAVSNSNAAALAEPRAPLPHRRTDAILRASPALSRVPCRRAARCLPDALRRWRARWLCGGPLRRCTSRRSSAGRPARR